MFYNYFGKSQEGRSETPLVIPGRAPWRGCGDAAVDGRAAGSGELISPVVPANAGTHTPLRSLYRKYLTPARLPISRGVWVPAQGRDDVESFAPDTPLRSRGAMRPKFCTNAIPRNKEGAGNAGCALHPRSRVQNCAKNAHTSIQVQRKHAGIPRAMALRLMP